MDNIAQQKVLIGNTFPLGLARRRITIEPVPLGILRDHLDGRQVASFWGHASTLAVARDVLGVDLTPETARPALVLNDEGYPTLNGTVFDEVWVLSPDYQPGYRPQIGEEATRSRIVGWQVIRLSWK